MTTKKKTGRGGKRKGAGRKPKWLPGTELKTMRLPSCLEKELFEYAQKRIAQINHQSSSKVDTPQLQHPTDTNALPSTINKSAVTEVNNKTDQKTIKLELWLRVENNNKFIRRKKRVREQIEQWCLSQYHYHKPFKDMWDYQLTIPYETEEDLENKIHELYGSMFEIADSDCCFIEASIYEKKTNRIWY